MPSWKDILKDDPTPWLLEQDNPSVRYLTLIRLLDKPESDPDVQQAKAAIMNSESIKTILDNQEAEGYWMKPGRGYSPKYRATVWQIIFLGLLGADGADERVQRGCEYVLDNGRTPEGAFTAIASHTLNGAIQCLNGNLIHSLIRLGYWRDVRLAEALDWLARSITGRDFEPKYRYYKSGLVGPNFLCAANNKKPCA